MAENYQAIIAPEANAPINSAPTAHEQSGELQISNVITTLEAIAFEQNPVDQYRLIREAYGMLGNVLIPRYRARKVQHNFANNNQPRTNGYSPIPDGASPIFGVPAQ